MIEEKIWRIEPMDTLFFRGGQPFTAGESGYLESIFPPTPQTTQGMVRTSILFEQDADIKAFQGAGPCTGKSHEDIDLSEELGGRNGYGKLDLIGPHLLLGDELLFPVPLDLLKQENALGLLVPSEQVTQSDLGAVRFPANDNHGMKTVKGCWITMSGLKSVLLGHAPDIAALYRLFSDDDTLDKKNLVLANWEPKVGLARDNRTRVSLEGHLYTIAPLRLAQTQSGEQIALAVRVRGIDERLHPTKAVLCRFGGEGKLVKIQSEPMVSDSPDDVAEMIDRNGGRFKIVFTTPGRIGENWLPSGFEEKAIEGVTEWHVNLNGVQCVLVSACVGKAQQIGGWDLAANKGQGGPKPLKSFLPAGSVYFFKTNVDGKTVVNALNDQKIGEDTEIGHGHIYVGTW